MNDTLPAADATTDGGANQAAIARLRTLGVDVGQIADQPLPEGLWGVIESVVRHIRGKSARWYATASMYGRFLAVLQAGGTADELVQKYGGGRSLAPVMSRAEMRETVLAAGLPGPLNLWLAEVARRLRLWRSEKVAVAVELIDQFQSLLAAGKSPAEIVQSLGDPRVAARRYRHERIRERPRLWHVFRWTCRTAAAFFLIFAISVTWLLYRFHAVKAVPAGNEVEKLDAAAAAIPVEDRAWPLYAMGLERLGLPVESGPNSQELTRILGACGQGPEHEEWSKAKAFLKNNEASADLFLQGAARPRLGFIRRDTANNAWLAKLRFGSIDQTYPKSTKGFELRLPEASAFQYIQAILEGEAHRAAFEYDQSRAIRCLTAVGALGRQIWDEETFDVMRLNAMRTIDKAAATLAKLLEQDLRAPEDADLELALGALQSWSDDLQRDLLASSRQSQHDLLMQMYSDDGRFTRQGLEFLCMFPSKDPELAWFVNTLGPQGTYGLRKKIIFETLGPCLVPLVAGREELLEKTAELNDLFDAQFQSVTAAEPGNGKFEQEIRRLQDSAYLQIRYLPLLLAAKPSDWLAGSLAGRWKQTAQRETTLLVVAAELFRRRHGAWPESAEALAPEFLKSVPVDPYDGKPLRLTLIKGSLAVYSVGLDKADDTARSATGRSRTISEHDWQLFPPLKATAGADPGK